jgi:iron complex transport system permease protein
MSSMADTAAPRPAWRSARESRARVVLASCLLALLATAILSAGVGAVAIPPLQVVRLLAAPLGLDGGQAVEPSHALVFWSIRLPRLLLAVLVGASLGAAGTVMQGLFRNPLADPGLIGVSSSAALAAVATIVLGAHGLAWIDAAARPYALPAAAFLGGLAGTMAVWRIGTVAGQTHPATTLLAGIAVNAVAQAGIGFLVFVSDEQQLRDLSFWLLGSLAGATWPSVLPAIAVMLVPLVALPALARPLNALLLGEREAMHLGISTRTVTGLAIALCAVAVGGAVAACGTIGFIGLVVPHIVRLLTGPDHRFVLPGSMMAGAALLLAADLAARTVALPAELPVGVVTALLGGPFFAWLVRRRRHWG